MVDFWKVTFHYGNREAFLEKERIITEPTWRIERQKEGALAFAEGTSNSFKEHTRWALLPHVIQMVYLSGYFTLGFFC